MGTSANHVRRARDSRNNGSMHFLYLDESGCSGADLTHKQEPIFVLGGVAVKDQGWVKTTETLQAVYSDYFGGAVPANFELHSHELLSPNGDGFFAGHDRDRRNALAKQILATLADRGHQTHFCAFDKAVIAAKAKGDETDLYDCRVPYLAAYDHLLTYLEAFCKEHLGHTARGMMILDIKDMFQADIERITSHRRYVVPKTRRLKWVVEFSYPVDSQRHPMVQVSDLVCFCTRKFFEMDRGYKPDLPGPARTFFAECFALIHDRLWRKQMPLQEGRAFSALNTALTEMTCTPRRNWKRTYGLA